MSHPARENLWRLMAAQGLSIGQVAERTDLDERTIRGILNGNNKPHAQTLHRLAAGLGVAMDEFFVRPAQLLYRRFDQETNPLVAETLETHRELFDNWTEADFDELHSRVGAGGALTAEGVLESVRLMNHKHELHELLELILEAGQINFIDRMLKAVYEEHVAVRE